MRALLTGIASAIAISTAAAPAHAESLTEKIPQYIEQSGWLRAHYPGEPNARLEGKPAEHLEASTLPRTFIGLTPHLSIVARDWREAYSITDGKPLLFDRVRLIRSSRMAVTRVTFQGGRFLPYAEVSFGQWRADPELMPYIHSEYEVAGQFAAGFEAYLAPRCAVAWDVERTTMYRDQTDPQNLPLQNITATFGALRAEF